MFHDHQSLLNYNDTPRIVHRGSSSHGFRGDEHYYFEEIWCIHYFHYDFCMEINNVRHDLKTGDMTIVSPKSNITHYYKKPDCFHYFCLFKWNTDLLNKPLPLLVVNEPSILEKELLKRLVSDRNAGIATSMLSSLLWSLCSNREQTSCKQPKLSDKIENLLEKNYNKNINVQWVCEQVGMSHNYCTREYKKKFGMTIVQAITEKRMELASKLLIETDMRVQQIAYECGYSDLQHFNKTVRQRFGKSPRGLRD